VDRAGRAEALEGSAGVVAHDWDVLTEDGLLDSLELEDSVSLELASLPLDSAEPADSPVPELELLDPLPELDPELAELDPELPEPDPLEASAWRRAAAFRAGSWPEASCT
jgi:hypothetical protein